MSQPLRSSGKRPGRPASSAPRDCVVYSRLTTVEYEALLALAPPDASLSDLVRELLSEAIIARLLPEAERRALRTQAAPRVAFSPVAGLDLASS